MTRSCAVKVLPHLPQAVALLAGGFSAILGLVVMRAWCLRLTALIQVLQDSPLIGYNTALAFLLSSLALLVLANGWRRLAGGLSVLVALIGGLTLAQYVLDVDLGIDQLLRQDYLTSNLYPPGSVLTLPVTELLQPFLIKVERSLSGRPFPNTAFGFTLVGVATLSLSWTRGRRCSSMKALAELNAGILSAGVVGMSIISLLIYLSGLDAAHSWGYLTGIAIPAAVGFLILGLSLLVLSLDGRPLQSLPRWLPLSAGFGVFSATLFLWQFLESWKHKLLTQRFSLNSEIELLLSPMANIVLLEGLLLALLVILVVSFAQLAYRQATRLGQINRELKQSNSSLQDVQTRFEGILKIAIDGLISVDANQRITLFNQGAEKIFGYTAQEVLGQPLDLLLPNRLVTVHRQHLTEFNHSGAKARKLGERREIFGRRKDGTEFPAEVSISQLGSGVKKVFTAFVRDITERQRAEEALRESEAKLQAILDNAPVAIYLKDIQSRYLIVNRHFLNIFHVTPEQCIGKTNAEFLPASMAERIQANDREVVQIGAPCRYEEEILHGDGMHTYYSVKFPLCDISDNPYAICGISTDISDRKQAEKVLELQAVITKNMAGGICLVRAADSVIVYANPKFENLFGYDPGELNGKVVHVLNYEDDDTSAEETAKRIIHKLDAYDEAMYEVHNIRKDSTPFWCRGTISRFEHPEFGTVYVIVQYDITEHKQAEEQIKASLKEKEVLLKEIHHRVKNNLQIVDSLLKMQSRRIQDKQAADILLDSQNRIACIALIHEKLYRSENLANIDFTHYIPDLTAHLFDSYSIRSNVITLNTKVNDIFLEIDTAISCGLIINELVSNSIKYAFTTNCEGKIEVEFSTNSDRTMTLIVRDNGIGIPEQFDIEKTQTLGLTLVQGLVEQLEGKIDLDRTRGTEFRITLPGGRT